LVEILEPIWSAVDQLSVSLFMSIIISCQTVMIISVSSLSPLTSSTWLLR